MPKAKPQHTHPEDVMHLALERVQPVAILRADDDDPMQILQDTVTEVVALRQAVADCSSAMQTWLAKYGKR